MMDRRTFLASVIGAALAAKILPASPVEQAAPKVFACGFEQGVYDHEPWIVDANCPDDAIYLIERDRMIREYFDRPNFYMYGDEAPYDLAVPVASPTGNLTFDE